MHQRPLLAKSDGTTLSQHTQDVINTLIRIYENLPERIKSIPNLLEAGIISALFHDVGKAHPEFQKLLRNEANLWNKRRHEIISANFFAINLIKNMITLPNLEKKDSWILSIWLSIILHHKGIASGLISSTAHLKDVDHLRRIPFKKLERKVKINDLDALMINYKQLKTMFLHLSESLTGVLKNFGFNLFQFEFEDNFNFYKFFEKCYQDIKGDFSKPIDFQEILKEKSQYKILPYNFRYQTSILLALLKTSDHLASGQIEPIEIPLLSNFSQGINLYPFQKKVGSIRSSLILRAPTGAGKTNAAIAWAQLNQNKNGRLFYILPFQASLNAMYERLYNFLQSSKVKDNIFSAESLIGICHSKNLEFLTQFFENTDDLVISPKSLKQLTREIFYPIKVSTAHQLLRLLLFGKGWEQLMIELIDSIIIFDEIHAYEPRILGLIIGLMKILRKYNVKILIMTATIPSFIIELIRNEVFPDEELPLLELSPELEMDRMILERKRHHLNLYNGDIFQFLNDHENMKIIVDRYNNSETQLFICNTVPTAQDVYDLFVMKDDIFKQNSILLFHSRFNSHDRIEIERKIKQPNSIKNKLDQNSKNLILIATQVVEVSLDIDYNYGYFEIAPIDAIIQRMGRVNRNGKYSQNLNYIPNITLFLSALHDENIYNPKLVEKTIYFLQKRREKLYSEKDLLKIVEIVYPSFLDVDEKEFERGINHSSIVHYKEKMEVGVQREWIMDLIENSDSIIEILPIECVNDFEDFWNKQEYLLAKQLILSVHVYLVSKSVLKTKKFGSFRIKVLQDNNFQYNSKYGLRYLKNRHKNFFYT